MKTIAQLISELTWFDLINKLKSILNVLSVSGIPEAPITSQQYVRINGNWALIIPSSDSRPYKVYSALLTQTGTNAPEPTVLENTLGFNIVWTRTSDGFYQTQVLSSPKNKIWHTIKTASSEARETSLSFITNKFILQTYSSGGGFITTTDGKLDSTPIEIRVYN